MLAVIEGLGMRLDQSSLVPTLYTSLGKKRFSSWEGGIWGQD